MISHGPFGPENRFKKKDLQPALKVLGELSAHSADADRSFAAQCLPLCRPGLTQESQHAAIRPQRPSASPAHARSFPRALSAGRPGEISKTYRLTKTARDTLSGEGIEADLLDLSLLTSDYKRRIHPCKACVSTAMPLCHWPCSCYPNHALGQVGDWMSEIYERWVSAHGVLLVTPVYWYQVASPLKLMMDRLVCADGGNPDPTSTHGKDPQKAKALELQGWPYPKHLAGRAYGVVVHGDVSGIEPVRHALCDWLDWMGLIDSGAKSQLDRFIGYYEPYATSHEALDRDAGVQEEVRNAARAVAAAVKELRAGRLSDPDRDLRSPRPK